MMVDAGFDLAGPLKAFRLAAGRSNLTYRITDGDAQWLLRRPPTGGLTPSAHDVAREHRITSALMGAGVPVAIPLVLCENLARIGSPFTVASWVDGRTIQTAEELEELSDEDVLATTRALVRNLAHLHSVDYRAVGLADFARPDQYAERQLKRWAGQWQRVKVADHKLAGILFERLSEHVPVQLDVAVIHGDFRIDNVILDREDPAVIRAIVDWELSTLGDPVADVALMAAYRHPALCSVLGLDAAWASDRLWSPGQVADAYESVAGAPLRNWEFFLALGFYKLAVIAQGIDHRYRAGATSGSGFEKAGAAVPELFAAGLRALASTESV